MDLRFFTAWTLGALALVALVSYLIGSVSFAVIVSRVGAQDDVRRHGSGNAGMTNILRNYGKKMAALTAVGDFGKGVVAVALGRLLFPLLTGDAAALVDAGYVAGFFVILGHIFPLYFGFKGGKGVLTGLGVLLMLDPVVFAILVVLLVPVVFLVRIVSLVSILGYALFPVFTVLVNWLRGDPFLFKLCFAACIAAIGIFMHRSNIQRLLNGTEYRFGQKKKDNPPARGGSQQTPGA